MSAPKGASLGELCLLWPATGLDWSVVAGAVQGASWRYVVAHGGAP